MTNIIVASYPIGKVETMKCFNLREQISEILSFIPDEDLVPLKGDIDREINNRKNEELNKLKKNAEEALKSFLDAGGYVIGGGVTYGSIGEDFDLNEPIIFLG
jgi:hypothetical protein|nr:MAG TPA: hypothetical protein [Caudoviricetes sp.]